MSNDPIEQTIADWFAAKLATITLAAGYGIELSPERIYTDGEPEPKKDPPVPQAVYDDDAATWEETEDGDDYAVLEMAPEVRLLIQAAPATAKRQARIAENAVTSACRLAPFDEGAPNGILSITPAGKSRSLREGSYLEIRITFAVRADGSNVI